MKRLGSVRRCFNQINLEDRLADLRGQLLLRGSLESTQGDISNCFTLPFVAKVGLSGFQH
jgi:hypothetical protein